MYNNNLINLSKEVENNVKEFIERVLCYIEDQYDNEMLNPLYYEGILLIIAEGFEILHNKQKWEKIGYDICKAIKHDLESYGVMENKSSMICGYGLKCFSVSQYSNKTGNLKKFSESLNKLLLGFACEQADNYLENKTETCATHYDTIVGLSGTLYYLLDFNWSNEEMWSIKKIISYLVSLAKAKDHNGTAIINFYITSENQATDEAKIDYPNGNINFGLSHGMIGPLIALSKAYKLGIVVDDLKESIETIANIYEKYKCVKDGIPLWPAQLPLEEYLEGTCDKSLHISSSWCYGNISIAMGLKKVAQNMGWISYNNLYEKDLIRIINQPIEKFMLCSPALCHGYSSILAIRTYEYKKIRKPECLVNIEENIKKILSVIEYNNVYVKEHPEVCEDKKFHIEGLYGDLSILDGVLGIALVLMGTLLDNMKYGSMLLID